MNEKIFTSIRKSGAASLTIGIIMICVGVATGILAIINGAKLLTTKSDTLF